MKIIESFLCGKRPDQSLCEDGFVVTDNWAAVVDGSTSKSGRSGGLTAMQTVISEIGKLPPYADLRQAVEAFTSALASKNPPEAAERGELRLTCSTVIYSSKRREVWMIGDCQCRFGGKTHTNPKLVDSVLTEARTDALKYLLKKGYSIDELRKNDLGRKAIFDLLREQTNFQNCHDPYNPFRYTVLDGFMPDMATIPIIPVGQNSELILASDGYPVIFDNLRDSENYLHDDLNDDPLRIYDNAATKGLAEGNNSFDDRCYVRLAI